MQWGDFVAELWLYVPLIGFWLVAIILGIAGITASIRSRQRPGGLDYEFLSTEPERPSHEGEAPEGPNRSVRPPGASESP